MSDEVVYGLHAVRSVLSSSKRTVIKLIVSEERNDKALFELIQMAKQKGISIQKLSNAAMKQRFQSARHQGVVAEVEKPADYGEKDLKTLLAQSKSPCLILILDGITDPHNLGACLRGADATGVDFVITPKDKSAPLTSVVSKVACGAAESIPLVRVTNLVRAMEWLKSEGVWIYGAAGEANKPVYDIDLTGPTALVMGAEGSGMRRLTREHCDALFSLPMLGSVSSLNVSVAAGVCLYEGVRQRLKGPNKPNKS